MACVGWVEASVDTSIAVLSLEDYERICADSVKTAIKVLRSPPSARSEKDIDFLMDELFVPRGHAMPFFAKMPSNVLQRNICSSLSVRKCDAGEAVYRTGDPSDMFFIVIAGEVQRESENDHGREHFMRHGATFGDWDNDNFVEPRDHSMIAVGDDVVVAFLNRAAFMRLCNVKEIEDWFARFWTLITTKEPQNDEELHKLFDDLDVGKLIRQSVVPKETTDRHALQSCESGSSSPPLSSISIFHRLLVVIILSPSLSTAAADGGGTLERSELADLLESLGKKMSASGASSSPPLRPPLLAIL